MAEYRAMSGSAAEDLFIELFSDTFGAEKAGYLYSQFPFQDMKGASLMQAAKTEQHSDTQRVFTKRIGSTTYRVSVHFSNTSRETVDDKILRLMRNEGQTDVEHE